MEIKTQTHLASLREMLTYRLAELRDAGSYGDCATCGEPIPLARLWAQPAATRCAHCQAQSEKAEQAPRAA